MPASFPINVLLDDRETPPLKCGSFRSDPTGGPTMSDSSRARAGGQEAEAVNDAGLGANVLSSAVVAVAEQGEQSHHATRPLRLRCPVCGSGPMRTFLELTGI